MKSSLDVIQTSQYIPTDLAESIQQVPDYEGFSKAVAIAVNSVQRNKYGHEAFFSIIETMMNNYNIPEAPVPTAEKYKILARK